MQGKIRSCRRVFEKRDKSETPAGSLNMEEIGKVTRKQSDKDILGHRGKLLCAIKNRAGHVHTAPHPCIALICLEYQGWVGHQKLIRKTFLPHILSVHLSHACLKQ